LKKILKLCWKNQHVNKSMVNHEKFFIPTVNVNSDGDILNNSENGNNFNNSDSSNIVEMSWWMYYENMQYIYEFIRTLDYLSEKQKLLFL